MLGLGARRPLTWFPGTAIVQAELCAAAAAGTLTCIKSRGEAGW